MFTNNLAKIRELFNQHQISKPLGRWRIENCSSKLDYKIDLSNEDHCGPCGQYALKKIDCNNTSNKTKMKIDNKNNNENTY